MAKLIAVTDYRRRRQMAYNTEHGITPRSVQRAVQESLHTVLKGREVEASVVQEGGASFDLSELLRELEAEMVQAASNMEYERAAVLRDQINELKSGTGLDKIEPKRRPYPTAAKKKAGAKKDAGSKARKRLAKPSL